MKIIEKIKENKIFFVVFGILVVTSVIYLSQKEFLDIMKSYYAPLYVVNFDCGFSSRLLIGAIFSLFFEDKLSLSAIITVLLVVYFLMCFCLSLFINNRLKKTQYETNIGTYIALFMLCPVNIAFLRYFGTTDMFWIFLVIASFLVVDKKYLRWLVPVFCVIGLAIHEVFIAAYLPIIAIAIFYQFLKNPKINNFIFLLFCALIIGVFSVYFLFIGDNTMKMTSDEMVRFAIERLETNGFEIPEWYMRSIFFWEVDDIPKYTDTFSFRGYLEYNFRYFILNRGGTLKEIFFQSVSNILLSMPFFFVFIKLLKKEKHSAKKLTLICSIFIPVVSTVLLFFSTDTERFSQHYILNILFMILFFIKEKDTAFEQGYNDLMAKIDANKTVFAFLGLIIASIVLSGVLI